MWWIRLLPYLIPAIPYILAISGIAGIFLISKKVYLEKKETKIVFENKKPFSNCINKAGDYLELKECTDKVKEK